MGSVSLLGRICFFLFLEVCVDRDSRKFASMFRNSSLPGCRCVQGSVNEWYFLDIGQTPSFTEFAFLLYMCRCKVSEVSYLFTNSALQGSQVFPKQLSAVGTARLRRLDRSDDKVHLVQKKKKKKKKSTRVDTTA